MWLHLERQEWLVGKQLGGGGFGQVFTAKSAAGDSAAVKFVPKAPGAERELLFEDLAGARNIVPIIDRGETEDSWVLVMPRAEKSLRQHLAEAAGPLDANDVVAILSDIATALVDLDRRVVHRDLKPENVLLLDGRWCLADFGIARYADDTTAPDTRKHAWSPPYAAPEQWRRQRATSATDVYALGGIAYELLARSTPFPGPGVEDFYEQHLHETPPSLPGIPSTLDALIQECLDKGWEARPSPKDLSARLARIARSQAPSGGLAALECVHRKVVSRRVDKDREQSAWRSEAERRDDLYRAATRRLSWISDTLRETIAEHAPSVAVEQEPGGWTIRLNRAELQFTPPTNTPVSPWGDRRPAPAFDVIAHASLTLTVPGVRTSAPFDYKGRSHSLWFCDAKEVRQYQWFETAFMLSTLMDPINLSVYIAVEGGIQRGYRAPFSLAPGQESVLALSAGIDRLQVAWPFTVVNIGESDEFIDRWAGWLADGAQDRLQHPSELPERPTQGSWRQR